MAFSSLPLLNRLPDLGLLHQRVSFDAIQKENIGRNDLRGRNVLVTGGTNGIGAAIALSFAKRGANLYIAGRNADAASKLLAKAKSLCLETWPGYTDQVLQFFAWDASLISDNKRFANEMRLLFEEKGGLDFLVMTQGGIGNGQRKETADGHEWLLALQDFSRYIIAASLLPVLKLGRRGVVIDVLSAGVWNKFDDENLELVGKSPDFYHVASRDGPIHDIMSLEFNQRCPEVIYNHIYPGPTQTDVTSTNNTGFITKYGFAATTRLIGQSAEQFAEIAFNVATKWEGTRNENPVDINNSILNPPTAKYEECRTWGASGEKVKVREYPSRPEVRAKIWKWLETETGVIVA
ncbi:hypothetical protein FRC04_011637 [Tulasnella sp. 424]|nr:hypothetical protein FRC04_011637 [Tulasnella sp. 424]KAG8971455.1 hypothetical protein FRC05_011028 [Tulasnella sp. 425]